MLVESICIILILGFISFVFLRSGRRDYAVATFPLIILPLFHTLVFLIDDMFNIVISTNLKAGIDISGLVISIAAIALMSNNLKTKKSRFGYMLVCGVFVTVLALIFIFNHYAPHL